MLYKDIQQKYLAFRYCFCQRTNHIRRHALFGLLTHALAPEFKALKKNISAQFSVVLTPSLCRTGYGFNLVFFQ